jgi:hypothetical protein
MKPLFLIIFALTVTIAASQTFDTTVNRITVEHSTETENFFRKDLFWRGADGASSIDLENGKVLWLFSDTFISGDSSGLRKNSKIIRNSIAIQNGYNLKNCDLTFYWNKSNKQPKAFFSTHGKFWFWTGHGVMVKDKLIIFLMKVRAIKTGLGFETFGWYAVLVSNPYDDPSKWKMKYIEGPDTYGYIAGSAAILKDDKYLYAYGAVEPATHEVYLLRWELDKGYNGNLERPEWWMNGKWEERKTRLPVPEPLFIAETEYSVHYDSSLKKYIQIQSFGFGEGKIGIRTSDNLQGPWTNLYLFYAPEYTGVKKPFMYSAKAHPELKAEGIYITYNVNSFDFSELLDNHTIYFPKIILMKFSKR